MADLKIRIVSDRRGNALMEYVIVAMIVMGTAAFVGQTVGSGLTERMNQVATNFMSQTMAPVMQTLNFATAGGCQSGNAANGGCPVRVVADPVGIPGISARNSHVVPAFVIAASPSN